MTSNKESLNTCLNTANRLNNFFRNLEEAEDKVANIYNAFAQSFYRNEVLPFCKKYNLRYVFGLGRPCFLNENDKEVIEYALPGSVEFKTEFSYILRCLNSRMSSSVLNNFIQEE